MQRNVTKTAPSPNRRPQTVKNTSNVKTQSDGAKVYIKEISPGKYNVIVEGDRGIITALKNISKKSLDRLTKNYNWR